MKTSTLVPVAAVLALSMSLPSCGSSDDAVTTDSAQIQGALTFESPTATEGQVLLWAGLTEVPADLHPRPVAAVNTDSGHYELAVQPGQYLVRATALDGTICGESDITVQSGQSVTVDFTCP